MSFPDLSQVSNKALGQAFSEWVTAMQQEHWWYRPDGLTPEQAAANREAARERLGAIHETREAILGFIAEYRRTHPPDSPTAPEREAT